MNRDEQRDREELAKINTLACSKTNTQLVYAVDKLSTGTWVAVNNHGVTLAILNRYQDTKLNHGNIFSNGNLNHGKTKSRGEIIPEALASGKVLKVIEHCKNIIAADYMPFDLLLFSQQATWKFSWDSKHYQSIQLNNQLPFLHSSSSVDTSLVIDKRTGYFESWLKDQSEIKADNILDEIHLQHDVKNPSHSILMAREKTHTKSIVQIITSQNKIDYNYLPKAEYFIRKSTIALKKLKLQMLISKQIF